MVFSTHVYMKPEPDSYLRWGASSASLGPSMAEEVWETHGVYYTRVCDVVAVHETDYSRPLSYARKLGGKAVHYSTVFILRTLRHHAKHGTVI